MSNTELSRIAARADLCRLLAACYYEPGPEFVEEKMFRSLADAATAVDPGMGKLAEVMGTQFEAEPLERLRVDYTALFLHPTLPRALPYESSWTGTSDPVARQKATDDVIRFYRENGFNVAEDFRDLPDHIAAELEFVYALLFREAAARNVGDEPGSARAAAIRQSFVAHHLGRWIERFSEAMREGAGTPFYKSVAELTERFVASEWT